MTKVYKVWDVIRREDKAKLTAVVLAASAQEALERVAMSPAVDVSKAHTDDAHSLNLEQAPHWILIEDECGHSACLNISAK